MASTRVDVCRIIIALHRRKYCETEYRMNLNNESYENEDALFVSKLT